MGHSAVLVGDSLVIFGGRISPSQPLNDAWSLHLPTWTWKAVQCRGNAPQPRFRHTSVAWHTSNQVAFLFNKLTLHCSLASKSLQNAVIALHACAQLLSCKCMLRSILQS